jgi:hypothetical protein
VKNLAQEEADDGENSGDHRFFGVQFFFQSQARNQPGQQSGEKKGSARARAEPGFESGKHELEHQ